VYYFQQEEFVEAVYAFEKAKDCYELSTVRYEEYDGRLYVCNCRNQSGFPVMN